MFLEQFPEDGKFHGWVEVICGSMFSGKTEELIRRLRRINFAGQELLLFKPKIDKRYSEENVVSHNGASFQAIQVESAKEILEHWKKERIVAIDEAQFFDDGIVEVVNHLAANGVRVICAGLDMDFQAKPFGPMPFLMASAEYVTKVHAICMSCGNLAQFSHRKTQEKEQVLVGAVDEYEPLCRSCYNKIKH
ncbi:thymidine kinase [Brumimicrobium glaciale]|jgi:thymidine kinase|uniref:Thymidine kinase n=1 Tax=Brumimicrobium glaciale TaxID=200475 RepID=A0A4Q4KQN2_9FLAO|nr:thymidine kinase [Brumimicrobium glaciale]RYM35483.1 thymidine kinase [Brumimicrobium glaciale]